MNVFINPGHDQERDSGAVNPVDGTREADITAHLGRILLPELEKHGLTVRSMQSDDLAAVVEAANTWPADVFVSLHCNASPDHQASGTETLYCSSEGRKLATLVQDAIIKKLPLVDRGCKLRKDLYVLNATDMPAILVELGFIDNEKDLPLLKNLLIVYAQAITKGVNKYLVALTKIKKRTADVKNN